MLIERDDLVHRLDVLLETGADGGAVVLLEGPIGCGKTALLRELTARAAARGLTCLPATGARAERVRPLGLARQLLRGTPAVVEAAGDGPELTLELIRRFDAILDALPRTAGQPLVIGVDDLQLADPASLEFLLYLARRLPAEPILLVLAAETETTALPEEFRAELSRQAHFTAVRVPMLSGHGVAELLGVRLGAARAGECAETALEVTAGSPLLVTALAEDYAAGGDAPSADRYGRAAVSCIHRGEPSLAGTAAALAVLGGATDPADLAAVAELERESVEVALRALTSGGLLSGGVFRHEVARSAVLAGLSAARRATLHQRAAKRRHELGAPASVVVDHLLATERAPEPAGTWAVDVLVEAAERALLADEAERAAHCLQVARRHCGDAEEGGKVSARLVRVLWRIGPSACSATHLTDAAAHARGQDLFEIARQLLWHGRAEEAAAVLDRVREGAADAPLAVANLETWLAHWYPPVARRRPPAVPAQRGGSPLYPDTDRWLHAAARLVEALMNGLPHRAVEQAEQVLRDVHLGRAANWAEEAAVLALEVLVRAGKGEDAMTWGERLLTGRPSVAGVTGRARITAVLGLAAVERGDLVEAVRRSREAFDLLPPQAWGVGVGVPLGVLVEALTGLGDLDEAAAWLVVTVPDAASGSLAMVRYRYGRGLHQLATGHAYSALADFSACGDLLRSWGLGTGEVVAWRLGAARAWLQIGNTDQARRMVHHQLAQAATRQPRARGLTLRVLAAASPASRRLEQLTEALELLESAGDLTEQAYVLADLSRAYGRIEETRTARLMLRRALHVARVAQVRPLVRELMEVPDGSDGVEPESIDSAATLSDSERRVAGLAVMGYSNREIGAKLYITRSTVEQHLTRVYRKLGVKRRRDLPTDLWTDVTDPR
ncbi:AAA family ATPase [Amycolatopsis sp. cmx-4-83]|uniref:helix-turn-helix transcriptional regulator n=1 Tax=Amycolatopsis sp. cmx-4-83 TaxID=2790940 RepID=UPI0039793482